MVGEMRNKLVKDALAIGCTHIFMVDDDLMVPQDTLLKLYGYDLDVIGAWYPKKTSLIESASMIYEEDGESKRPVPKDSTGLIEIDWSLSAGCTLYKTDVFRKMQYPWFLTTKSGTEDTYFCARLREHEIKAWVDTDIKVGHVDKSKGIIYSFDGIKPYEGNI